jgi:type I restriction enzyme S subunit
MKFYKETDFQETEIGKIPKDWKAVVAEDVCGRVTDGTHDTPKPVKKGYFLVTSKHIKNGNIDFSEAYLISEDDFFEVNKRSKVDVGDVLFSMIGTVAMTAIVKQEYPPFAIKNVGLFKTGGNLNLAFWLHYYFQSRFAQKYLNDNLKGTTQKYIPLYALRKFPIVLPPSSEQQRITDILSTVDNAIKSIDNAVARLERLKKALMNELLTGRIRVREENGKLTFYTETDFQETEIGRIPKEWKIANLGSIAKVSSGNTAPQDEKYFENGKYPFIRIQHLTELQEQKYPVKYDLINEYAVLDLKLKKFKKGSIIFPKSGESIKLEKRAILKEDSYVVNHLAVIEPFHENIDNLFLFYYLCTVRTSNYLLKTTMPSLNLSTISNFLVPVPPIKEQQMIADILSTADSAIGLYYKEKYVLGRLRKGLMDMLLTGKVRVRED